LDGIYGKKTDRLVVYLVGAHGSSLGLMRKHYANWNNLLNKDAHQYDTSIQRNGGTIEMGGDMI